MRWWQRYRVSFTPRSGAEEPDLVGLGLIIIIIVLSSILLSGALYLIGFQRNVGLQTPRTALERDIVQFRSDVQDKPTDPVGWVGLARSLRRAGRLDSANEAVKRGLAATKDAPALQVEQARLLLLSGEREKARTLAKKAAELEDDRLRGESSRLAAKRIDVGAQRLDQGTRIEAYSLVAEIEASQSRWREAIAAYSAVLQSDPNLIDVLVARGDAYLAAGDMKRAAADFSAALRFDARNRPALQGLRRATGEAGSK
jgi:tetratricopeptide (TPR) repeat protein